MSSKATQTPTEDRPRWTDETWKIWQEAEEWEVLRLLGGQTSVAVVRIVEWREYGIIVQLIGTEIEHIPTLITWTSIIVVQPHLPPVQPKLLVPRKPEIQRIHRKGDD